MGKDICVFTALLNARMFHVEEIHTTVIITETSGILGIQDSWQHK